MIWGAGCREGGRNLVYLALLFDGGVRILPPFRKRKGHRGSPLHQPGSHSWKTRSEAPRTLTPFFQSRYGGSDQTDHFRQRQKFSRCLAHPPFDLVWAGGFEKHTRYRSVFLRERARGSGFSFFVSVRSNVQGQRTGFSPFDAPTCCAFLIIQIRRRIHAPCLSGIFSAKRYPDDKFRAASESLFVAPVETLPIVGTIRGSDPSRV